MNRQVVSSTALTQSYSFSYSILIYSSIRPFVQMCVPQAS